MLSKFKKAWRKLPHHVRWIGVSIIGGALVVVGLVFLVLPGPGIPFLIAGLAILASEFTWAEIMLHKTKEKSKNLMKKVSKKNKK